MWVQSQFRRGLNMLAICFKGKYACNIENDPIVTMISVTMISGRISRKQFDDFR